VNHVGISDKGHLSSSFHEVALSVFAIISSECCVVEGDDRREAYATIVCGEGLSHEIAIFAGAETINGVEGTYAASSCEALWPCRVCKALDQNCHCSLAVIDRDPPTTWGIAKDVATSRYSA
jgi:hypothetical protein